MTEYSATEFFESSFVSVNDPRQFVSSRRAKAFSRLPGYVYDLFRARALLHNGQSATALKILEQLRRSPEANTDHLFSGKLHLVLYSTKNDGLFSSAEIEEFLLLATRQTALSGSVALECELKIAQCLIYRGERDITTCEEQLRAAMALALASDHFELRLMVQLAYGVMYQLSDLHLIAKQELMLMRELADKQRYPNIYCIMLSHLGVSYLKERDPSSASLVLEECIALAEEKGLVMNIIPALLNYGILKKTLRDYPGSIEVYLKCQDYLLSAGLENSENMRKLENNLAQGYGFNGDAKKAVSILKMSLDRAEQKSDRLQTHILLVNIANMQIELHEFESAISCLEKAIAYFTDTKNHQHLATAYLCLARLYEEKGDYPHAFEQMEQQYYATQRHFQEFCANQTVIYQKRIDSLRSEFFALCSQGEFDHGSHRQPSEIELVGKHPLVGKAKSQAILAAKYPYVNVMITGESGTGKEIIARLIHNAGQAKNPMVAVNAAAIPQTLLESELFGHVKGAFTGAIGERKGKFVQANNGTLFLDEISDMPLECQAKLLRAIEYQRITPVGSDKEISVKCRIICATNQNLMDLIRENKFRLDLYHRLNKVEIYLPPLREREQDIIELTRHFARYFAAEFKQPVPEIEDGFFQLLENYRFPGNVRELMNIVERIFILAPGRLWTGDFLTDLLPAPHYNASLPHSVSTSLQNSERQILIDALNQTNWVQKEAAALLGMTESTLSRHIRKLGINRSCNS